MLILTKMTINTRINKYLLNKQRSGYRGVGVTTFLHGVVPPPPGAVGLLLGGLGSIFGRLLPDRKNIKKTGAFQHATKS